VARFHPARERASYHRVVATESDAKADIDWARSVSTSSGPVGGRGRLERCKDGEDRWVKLPAATMAALQAHLEAMDLEGSVNRWTPEQRELAFPNTVGGSRATGRSSSSSGRRSSQLPTSRTGSPTRCDTPTPRGRSRPARISDGSRTSSGTPRSRRPRAPTATSSGAARGRVNLDAVLGGVHSRPPASTLADAGGVSESQLRDTTREVFMVEGKGFGRRGVITR